MDIKECYKSLKDGFNQWKNLLANPRFCMAAESIVWYDFIDLTFSAILDAEEFSRAVENGQYSFQLIEDGSILRIAYDFSNRGRQLSKASLAYIQAPSSDVHCLRTTNGDTPSGYYGHCSWVRVDYDPANSSGPTHMACHLHLSTLPMTRIPLSRLPSPKQFIGWIISIVSPESFEETVRKSGHVQLNAPCFAENWESNLAHFFHLSVPPSAALGQLKALEGTREPSRRD